MSSAIIIRDYKPNDAHFMSEVVRSAYLSNVMRSWQDALMREITFQLIVMSVAMLFIFVGVPLFYCVIALPMVMIIIYIAIYASFLIKSAELVHSRKPLHCWVAEACEPFILLQKPEEITYKIMSESKANSEGFDKGNYKRKIIGTVAVTEHLNLESAAWLFRLAVIPSYQRKGVGRALVREAQNWCRNNQYNHLDLAMSECQEVARQLFVDTGFEIKQLYHKQLMGSVVTLLMYHLGTDLSKIRPEL